VIRSKAPSGGVSRMLYRRTAAIRSSSFAGASTLLIVTDPVVR